MSETGQNLDELMYELEWRKCFPDWDTSTVDEKLEAFRYFCRTYWSIRHPKKGRMLFDMYPAQVETIRLWIEERWTLALKARQIGFSTMSGAFAFWLTYGYGDRPVIMLSRTERDAAKLLKLSKYGYRFLPDWLKIHPKAPIVESNQLVMRMTNESYIESLPSANDPARGESVFLVIVDEIGFLPNSDEAWASIEPTADVGGRVIMLGTANGEGNLLHREWVRSDGWWTDRDGKQHLIGTGEGRFMSIFHGWWANGRDDEWYDAKKKELPEWQLAQEYPSNPDEAFLKSGRPVFDLAALSEMELLTPDAIGHLAKKGKNIEFVQDGGPLKIWQWPNKGGKGEHPHRYMLGADVAEGLEHGDFSSIHVIDAGTSEVVAHWHGHIEPDAFASAIALLGEFYNQALAIVEVNNHGLATLIELQRLRYFPIFRRRRLGNRQKSTTEALGWATSAKTKPLAIDELEANIRTGGLKIYDQATVQELRVFVRAANGSMAAVPPNHDDRVMSLAIANQGFNYVFAKEYKVKQQILPNTLAWWMNRTELWDDEPSSEPFIGSTAST